MNKTLIVYDANGKIWVQMTGNYVVPEGIPYLEVEVPEGKLVAGVDVTVVPRVPIYVDSPKSDELTRLALLEVAFNEFIMSM